MVGVAPCMCVLMVGVAPCICVYILVGVAPCICVYAWWAWLLVYVYSWWAWLLVYVSMVMKGPTCSNMVIICRCPSGLDGWALLKGIRFLSVGLLSISMHVDVDRCLAPDTTCGVGTFAVGTCAVVTCSGYMQWLDVQWLDVQWLDVQWLDVLQWVTHHFTCTCMLCFRHMTME